MTHKPFRSAALACFICAAAMHPARADERLPRTLPNVERAYQDRLERVTADMPRQPFRGSASIVPSSTFPWVASLGLAGSAPQSGHFCGATFIAPQWALTAAHCVTDARPGSRAASPLDPSKIQLLTGTQQLYRGGRVQRIARIVVHPDYRVTAQGVPENDLALLQTAEPADVGALPIATPELARANIAPGDVIAVTGWGSASFEESNSISYNLLIAFVEPVERAKCNEAYGGAVTDKMFCAGVGTADACQGDSGGPAIGFGDAGVPGLIGIVSWGSGCTRKQYPGVYVDVSAYRGWINETIGATK